MTSKEWTALAVLVGGGILLQIPGHDATEMDHAGRSHNETAAEASEVPPNHARVALDVTGMT